MSKWVSHNYIDYLDLKNTEVKGNLLEEQVIKLKLVIGVNLI
jgi:hypothetical protein